MRTVATRCLMHQFLNKALKITNSEQTANKYHSHLETIATLYSYKKIKEHLL